MTFSNWAPIAALGRHLVFDEGVPIAQAPFPERPERPE